MWRKQGGRRTAGELRYWYLRPGTGYECTTPVDRYINQSDVEDETCVWPVLYISEDEISVSWVCEMVTSKTGWFVPADPDSVTVPWRLFAFIGQFGGSMENRSSDEHERWLTEIVFANLSGRQRFSGNIASHKLAGARRLTLRDDSSYNDLYPHPDNRAVRGGLRRLGSGRGTLRCRSALVQHLAELRSANRHYP